MRPRVRVMGVLLKKQDVETIFGWEAVRATSEHEFVYFLEDKTGLLWRARSNQAGEVDAQTPESYWAEAQTWVKRPHHMPLVQLDPDECI